MHAHDASCSTVPVRMRMCALRMRVGHVEQMSKLVRAQEWLRLKRTRKVSIIYTWLVNPPQHDFFFCAFSCSLLALLASTVHWLHCFLFLNAVNRQLDSVLNSAKHVRCGGPAALSYPSSIVKKRRSSLSSIARLGIDGFHGAWLHFRRARVGVCVWCICVHNTG